MIKGAIFDVDGTLLDSMGIWKDVGVRYLNSIGVEAEPDLGTILFTMSIQEGAEYIKEHYSYEYYFYIDLDIKRESEEYAMSYQAVYENQKEYWRVVKKRIREYKKKQIKNYTD